MSWGPLWNEEYNKFEIFLKATLALSSLKDQMFFIFDGIYYYKAWIDYIIKLHKMDQSRHILVDFICLDTQKKIGVLLNAMHNINK